MAGANLSNKRNILQDAFGGLHSALNEWTPVFGRLPESPKKLTGRKLLENILHGRPMGGGAKGPNAASVGDPSTSKNSETSIYPTYHYHTIKVAWDVWAQSKGNSYVDVVEQEVRQLGIAERIQLERQTMGDGSGRLGVAATVSTSPGVVTFTVTGRDNKVFFEEGQRVQFVYDPSSGSDFRDYEMRDNPSQGYYQIETVSETGGTITVVCDSNSILPSGNPPVSTDTVIVADTIAFNVVTSNTENVGNEMHGLKSIIDNGNAPLITNVTSEEGFPDVDSFQSIDAATNGYWQATTIDGTGNYLDLDFVTGAADDISIHGGGNGADDIEYIVAHHWQIRKYLNSLYSQERYPNEGATGKFTSGSTSTFSRDMGPMIGERKTVKTRFCDKSIAYLVGPGIKRYSLKGYAFADMDGSMWSRDPSGAPAYIATAYRYLQIGTTRRNCSGRIEGLLTT